MKKLLLIILLFCLNQVNAQTTPYQKLLADSVTEFNIAADYPVMRLSNHNQTSSSCLSPIQGIWYAQSDSLFKGKKYKKIFCNSSYPSVAGIMREDTALRKVYFIPSCDSVEVLLYNFSLQQGDTISYNFQNQYMNYIHSGVFTVDSVKLEHDYHNYYHKHFYLKNHAQNGPTLEIVEGVGSTVHILFLYCDMGQGVLYECSSTPFSQFFDQILTCKSNNGNRVYFDSCAYNGFVSSGCFTVIDSCTFDEFCGGIQTFSNSGANIYPNPNNGSFVIEPSAPIKQTLQLFDVNGKLVLTQTINGKTNIDATNLPAGVYNLSLINSNAVTNKRLVIVK
ncbi:MAG TPA: T9SS type A sorting domain-containing protein [Bacteroidia bacterium]|nr:T9SS type A sorting domain-containing protein [Bacteroidia bacterium]